MVDLITAQDIHALENTFNIYIEKVLLEYDCQYLLKKLTKDCNVYIFSGLIRNFFTGNIYEDRDYDIVIEIKPTATWYDTLQLMKGLHYFKNSFGGFKIIFNNANNENIYVDIWQLKDTWHIKNKKIEASILSLIKSSFFNFSAIVYDYNNKQFIIDDAFLEFCNKNEMDIVNPENPNIPLCIINTFYYKEKYGFSIGNKLIKWINENYSSIFSFENVQKKHFGEIIFSNSDIYNKIKKLPNI